MSVIESVISLAIKLNGFHFEELAVGIASNMKDEVGEISESLNCVVLEKLQVLSMYMRESLKKSAKSALAIPSMFCDVVEQLWEPVFEKFIQSTNFSDSNHHVVSFLTVTIIYLHCEWRDDQILMKKLDPLFNSWPQDSHGKGSNKCQNALLVIESILNFPQESKDVIKVQKEVFQCLSKLITSFSGMEIQNTIHLRMVGVFLKGTVLLPYDEELFEALWKDIEVTFLKISDHINSNEHDYCQLLLHCLLLYDILLEICVSKKEDSLWNDFILRKASELLSNPAPWMITQCGLQCNDGPVRKQALFNLRQALFVVGDYNLNVESHHKNNDFILSRTPLFFWSDDSKEVSMSFWQNFLLIIETLEENQLHVITPVLNNFDSIAERTNTNEFPIHTSWVCVLLHRMMQHESKAVAREGIIMSLKLNPQTCPFLTQFCGTNILHGKNAIGVIPSLQDVNLYCDFKDPLLRTCAKQKLPVIATLTMDFLLNCFTAHPTPSKFLKFILSSLNALSWSAIPLYYFCNAMLNIPPYECWNGNDLNELKSLILECLRTHDIRLRHAILELLLQCMMKFVKCRECNSDDVLTVIVYTYDAKDFVSACPNVFVTVFSWMSEQFQSFQDFTDQTWQSVVHYACQRISQSCSQTNIDSIDDCRKISRYNALISLIVEESLKQSERENFLNQLVIMLNEIVEKGSTYIYMPKEKVCKAIIMLNCLIASWNRYPHKNGRIGVWKTVLKSLQSVQSYTQMRCSLNPEFLEDVRLFLDTWSNLSSFLHQAMPEGSWRKHVFQGFSPLLSIMQTANLAVCSPGEIKTSKQLNVITCNFMVLDSVCSLALKFNLSPDTELLLQIGDTLSSFDLGASKVSSELCQDVTVRDIVVKYSLYQWSSLPFLLQLSKEFHKLDHLSCLNAFVSCLDRTTECELPYYFRALGALLRNMQESLDANDQLICECLDSSWKVVQTLTHSPSFWTAYESFVSATFQANVLALPPTSQIHVKLQELLESIVQLASLRPAMLLSVCKTFISSWKQLSWKGNHSISNSIDRINLSDTSPLCKCVLDAKQLEIHSDFIFQCIIFNHIPKKEDLALQHVLDLRALENKGNSEENHLLVDYPKSCSWHVVPLSMISLLQQLDSKSQKDCTFVISIVKQLMELDNEITKKKPRYHQGSFFHHVKNSIHQAILVLIPYVTGDTERRLLVEHLLAQLKNDAQPSVRYFMEWTLAIVLIRWQEYQDILLEQLTNGESMCESGGSAKFSAICSYLTVAVFVGISKDAGSQEHYLMRLVDISWPWCMSQHFSIRLYALAVLLRVKIYFQEKDKLEVLMHNHPSMASCMSFADFATGNVKKNWEKMKDNFFLFDFHPIHDYSLETVYIILPRLCGMQSYLNDDDFLHVSISLGKPTRFLSGLDLWNRDDRLRKKEMSKWIPQEPKPLGDHTFDQSERYRRNFRSDEPTDNLEMNSAVDNVQKKIMPWLDMAESMTKDSLDRRPPGLILVASLIDKPSNLGGLTRTCEIFGAEAMVVQSSSCTSDKLYQSLSVTAHQWLPMKEVKPWKLEEYLISMRQEGYTLVGVEQTAQSVCLTKYRFPPKCVLILGNEKEGIPITLLKVLDVCVQIPQKGIVRSLNVHVSGAIAIWEYTKQHLTCS